MILTNARVIFPDGVRDDVEVVCSGATIAEVRARSNAADGDSVDLGGAYLAPGFIDIHVHGAGGRDTMEASSEAFRAICDYHASGGTTSLLLTTTTAPMADILDVVRAVESCAELKQIAGVHVEGPFISSERPGAQRREFIRDPEAAAIDELLCFRDTVRRVTLAPELPGAPEAIGRLTRQGIAVSGGHSDAWDEQARTGFEAGMRHVTHTFNCMSSARRRDSMRVAGLLEFALGEPEITCELIADGHHVSPTLMRMLYRAKRAEGICLVTDATAGAGLREGAAFMLGGRECVIANGACWLSDRSALAGSAAQMIDLVRTLVRAVGVPLQEAVAMATVNPARTLGSTNKGRIDAGAAADFVVFSPDFVVQRTFVAGEQVFPTGTR